MHLTLLDEKRVNKGAQPLTYFLRIGRRHPNSWNFSIWLKISGCEFLGLPWCSSCFTSKTWGFISVQKTGMPKAIHCKMKVGHPKAYQYGRPCLNWPNPGCTSEGLTPLERANWCQLVLKWLALCEISFWSSFMKAIGHWFYANDLKGLHVGKDSKNAWSAFSVGSVSFRLFEDLTLLQHSFCGWPVFPHKVHKWFS